MKKNLLLHRITKLGGLLLLMMFGLLNAQTRNLNTAKTQSSQILKQASEDSSKELKVADGDPLELMKEKAEDISKRDAFSKHYKNTDGSMTALIGSGPIHYLKNGSYEDIKTKITSQTDAVYSFANKTNLFESYFGATSNSGIKNKTAEGEVKEFLNTQMYWEVNGQPQGLFNSANVPATIDGDKAYYKNIYGSISAEFTSLVGKRKLNYIVPNKQALGNIPSGADYLVFSEDVVLPQGWVHIITEDGVLIKNQLGKKIYLYDNPTSTDAASEVVSEQNTIFETSLNGNTLTIKTKVKTDWLLGAQRQFPVMVDPTVTVYPTATGNYNTGTVNAGGTKWANNDIYAGMRAPLTGTSTTRSFYRGWASFNLTTLPTNIDVTSATFGFFTGINSLSGTQYLSIGRITSGIPNVTTGTTLFNMCGEFDGNAANEWFTLSAGQPTGDMAVGLVASQRNSIVSSIPSGIISLGFRPKGNYNTGTTNQVGIYGSTRPQATSNGRPYFILTYDILSADRTLIVSEAYTGATYANGTYTIANNTSVTATSGTRTGYNLIGWTGTGSVPATGTGNSTTFTITQNSTITWNWQQIGVPNNITFHNYGGTEQLAFNNSRSNTTTPILRLSHGTDPATDYQIEINPSSTFAAGTSWTQTFTGTYPKDTPANFTFTSGFTPVTGTTYYVRVRVKGAANTYSAWTTETYSFTHDTNYTSPNWFQTTQAQFTTDALSGTIADTSNNVVVASTGGNVITNGSFETNLNGWTISKPSWYTVASEPYGNTLGTNALNIYNSNPASFGNFGGDTAGVYQSVNMTGVSTVMVDLGYESTTGSNLSVNIEVYISDVSQTGLRTGIRILNWRPTQNVTTGNSLTIDVNSLGFTGNKLIKIVTYFSIPSTDYVERYFYIDNIRTTSLPQGTITSTPIALSSVQNVTRFEKLLWNQTLGGGTMNFKIQQTTLGGTAWTDVTGYTNISATGDGLKEFDLSEMTAYPQIRLVGTLNGANVKMHDWAVIYEESCDKLWSSTSSTDWAIPTNWIPTGIPTAKKCVKIPSTTIKPIILNGTDGLAKSLEIADGGGLTINANASLTVTDEITNNATAADFVVESDGNLVQVTPVTVNANAGDITLKRNSKMKRLDYIYWGSPVDGQNFINFSPNTIASRFYRYNEEFDSFHTISNLHDPMIKGEGYAIRAPNNQNATTPTTWTGIFVGKPNNGDIDVLVTKHPDSPTDPNNPSSGVIPRGKNMLSNPYPSNLDLEALTDGNLTIANGIYYFWTNTNDFVDNTQVPGNGQYGNYGSNHYATYSSSGAVPAANAVNGQLPTRYIRPGQGFLFEAKSGGTVTFNNNMRSIDSNSIFISNKGTENSPERFWLKLTTPINNTNTLLIAYISGATNSFEPRYDARFPQKTSDRFYSVIDDQELIIQGRQYPFSKTDLVTLGMAHFVAGNYKIEIADREGIFATRQNIYLKDKQTGIITNLSQASYNYTAEAGENNTRFEIIYEPKTVLVANESTKGEWIVYRDASDFVVKSSDKIIDNLELYDASGRLIFKIKGNDSKELRFNAKKLHEGMYILKVITKAGVITKKIIKY